MADFAWEHSKENYIPATAGRNPNAPELSKNDVASKERACKAAIEEYVGDDPLAPMLE